MGRTRDSAMAELAVAHAAMRFIAAKGLTEEFYSSGALTGALCDPETCAHPADMLQIKREEVI